MRQFRSSIPRLKYLLFTLHNQGYPWLCKTRFRLMVSLYRVGVEPTGFQRMISVHRTSHILRLSLSQERPDPDFVLCKCLVYHHKRQVLYKMKYLTLILFCGPFIKSFL